MPFGNTEAGSAVYHPFLFRLQETLTSPLQRAGHVSPLRQTIALATVLSLTRRCLAMATLERPS